MVGDEAQATYQSHRNGTAQRWPRSCEGLYSEKTGKTYDATVVLADDGQYANFKLEFDQQKGWQTMKLSRYEQETIILYNQAEATAEVYTHDPRLLEKLRRLAEKYPDQIVKKDRQTFLVPKRCVSGPGTLQRRAP